MKEFIDKTSEQSGTPINRVNLMAIQGFVSNYIQFTDNGIKITNNEGNEITEVSFLNTNGSTYMTLQGEKKITITATFTTAGIFEVLS